MKKTLIIILVISFMAMLGLTSCSMLPGLSNVSRVEGYVVMDDLIKDSPIIVTGIVAGKNEELTFKEVTFSLTNFKVDTSLRGAISGTIKILQTKSNEDPYIKDGDHMVLFLTPYIGPVAQDAYRMKGLFQGQYKIIGSKLAKQAENRIADADIPANIDDLKARASLIGYEPKLQTSTSK